MAIGKSDLLPFVRNFLYQVKINFVCSYSFIFFSKDWLISGTFVASNDQKCVRVLCRPAFI